MFCSNVLSVTIRDIYVKSYKYEISFMSFAQICTEKTNLLKYLKI